MKNNKILRYYKNFHVFIIIMFCIIAFPACSSAKKNHNGKVPQYYKSIKALGMPAYVTQRKRFTPLLETIRPLGINTIMLDIKQVDPRGDYYQKVPVVTKIKTPQGVKTKTVMKRKLIPRHLGNVFFHSTNQMVKKIGANRRYLTNITALQKKLSDKGFYLGVRFCLFGDWKMAQYLRENHVKPIDRIKIFSQSQSRWVTPERIKKLKNNPYMEIIGRKDSSGNLTNLYPVILKNPARAPGVDRFFVDPLNKTVLDYNLSLFKELYAKGIRIFVFDYVRMEDPTREKNYHPDKFLFNHVAVEQALKYFKNEIDKFTSRQPESENPLLSVSVFGRVLYKTYVNTMDPVGQNIKTFTELGYAISSMDYTHLLLKQYRDKPYSGRMKYLRHGMEKIGKEPFFPWVDSSARHAPPGGEVQRVAQELRAVIDSGIKRYIFWVPSGSEKEYNRIIKALRKVKAEPNP